MRPVRVSIDVPRASEDVYDFIDVMANHVRFTDHMLRDWLVPPLTRAVARRGNQRAPRRLAGQFSSAS